MHFAFIKDGFVCLKSKATSVISYQKRKGLFGKGGREWDSFGGMLWFCLATT